MKKIGFVDYYLNEWHSNNYPAWFRDANEKLGLDWELTYAWAELPADPAGNCTSEQWCSDHGVTLCDTLEELCEKSDTILILAPSDPDRHLPYVRTVFPYGKPTYVDKTFAESTEVAKEIFALSEQYGTPFFSTSALRYAEELHVFDKEISALIITGGGSNLPEYLIHMVEMAVILLKDPVAEASMLKQGRQRICRVTTVHGKQLSLIYSEKMSYVISAEYADGTSRQKSVKSAFFPILIEEILKFYESKALPFDPAQTLECMRMRDAILACEDL